MKIHLLPIFLCLITSILQAQPQQVDAGKYGEILLLNQGEARQILVEQVPFDSSWLHTSLGFKDSLSLHELPPGHYLFVRARQEQIVVSAYSRYEFEVNVLATTCAKIARSGSSKSTATDQKPTQAKNNTGNHQLRRA